jgi:hypothetical protein
VAQPADSLFLEPAGYVPYYSGLYTDDEIGLVSPKVTTYMRTEGTGWWMQFVKRERPTFLVERPHLRTFTTYGRYPLTAEERQWFVEHYERVRTFRYDPAAYHENRRVVQFLRWSAGHPDEFDLYRRVDSAPSLKPGR